jgi:hypothetical protein
MFRRRPLRDGLAALLGCCCVALVPACSGGAAQHAPGTAPARPASAVSVATAGPPVPATPQRGPGTPALPKRSFPRCRTSQLAAAFTGLNAASGGERGMTLILANHSARACFVYGYARFELLGASGAFPGPLPTHVTRVHAPHSVVILRPGQNAQALVTWNASPMAPGSLEHPQRVQITPPGAHAYLMGMWPQEPVSGGYLGVWPLRPAPPGPVPTGTGTVQGAFNGMCMTAAQDSADVVAWTCDGDSSQQWTAYSDDTLRIGDRCLDVAGGSTDTGATAVLQECDGSASQRWQISQVSLNPFGPITGLASGNVLTDPGASTVNGTKLELTAGQGDQSPPWHVSFYHYLGQ